MVAKEDNGMEQYPEMTIEEIEQRWPDEWVLIEVTCVKDYQVVAGQVIGHGSDQEVDRLVGQELAFHQQQPEAETFLFWTGEPIPEDMVVVL
jgi:hypothetical protein